MKKTFFKTMALIISMLILNQTHAQLLHNLLASVTITDTVPTTARPEVIATSNRVFVIYLAANGGNKTFNLQIYNKNMDTLIASQVLVTTNVTYGGPTDIRVTSDGQYLYAFYETVKSISAGNDSTFLWGAKYLLNDSFTLVANTSTPITRSKAENQLPVGGERVDDPAPLVGPSSIYVITRLHDSIKTTGNTIYRVRELDTANLMPLASPFDLDLSAIADGRARVNSFVYSQGNIYMALATTVSDIGVLENNDDGAQSDIILVKMDTNWTYNPANDVFTLSAEINDRENYISGLKADNNYLYVAYAQATGNPPTGQRLAWIKIFDYNFNLIDTINVKTTVWGAAGDAVRPSLEITGSRIYSGQTMTSVGEAGFAKVFIYDLSIPTGISFTQEKLLNIQIYPNPSGNAVNIELPVTNCQLKVFDALGNIVFEETFNSKHEIINLNLSSGMYLYQVKDNKQFISSGKLIIQ